MRLMRKSNKRISTKDIIENKNSANGNLDMGWVPFDACPPAEEIELVNQTVSPLTWDRDGQTNISVSGQLRFVDNATPIGEIPLIGYLVPLNEADLVPGPGGNHPGRRGQCVFRGLTVNRINGLHPDSNHRDRGVLLSAPGPAAVRRGA